MAQAKLIWQSKLVLLLVLPYAAADVVLEAHSWAVYSASLAIWAMGLSLLLGLVVLKLRGATPAGAFTGFAITATLIFESLNLPYKPWRTALTPVLAVSLLAHLATRIGRARKERMGIAEKREGRTASQVAANLGVAALVLNPYAGLLFERSFFPGAIDVIVPLWPAALAALVEAAADTVSSEIGQVHGGRPRMLTTLRAVEPGTDGAISFVGTLAGIAAGAVVALAGSIFLGGGWTIFWIAFAGGVFGLFFDSLLGATLERKGWLNNDMVNFLSTASAAGFALGVLAMMPHHGVG